MTPDAVAEWILHQHSVSEYVTLDRFCRDWPAYLQSLRRLEHTMTSYTHHPATWESKLDHCFDTIYEVWRSSGEDLKGLAYHWASYGTNLNAPEWLIFPIYLSEKAGLGWDDAKDKFGGALLALLQENPDWFVELRSSTLPILSWLPKCDLVDLWVRGKQVIADAARERYLGDIYRA